MNRKDFYNKIIWGILINKTENLKSYLVTIYKVNTYADIVSLHFLKTAIKADILKNVTTSIWKLFKNKQIWYLRI